MSRESRLRLIGLHVALIVSTIQGLMPDARSIVSPRALEWLRVAVMADGPGGGRDPMPGDESPSPLDDADHDGSSAEVVLPGEPLTPNLPSRRLVDSSGHPFASYGHCQPLDLPGSRLFKCACRPSEMATERIASLCRMTC